MLPENTPRRNQRPRRIPAVTWGNLHQVIAEHDVRQQVVASTMTAYCTTCRCRPPGYLEAHRHAAALPGHTVHLEMTTRTTIGTFAALLEDEHLRRAGVVR